VKTSVVELEDNKVKLSIEVDEAEFSQAIDAAFVKIARDARIPGFRPGKAPRKLLEARLGPGVARGEALRDAIPDYYARAVRENDVDVIAAPEIDITDGADEGPVVFDAVVEVRPVVAVPGYDSLRITLDPPTVDDDEIDAQVDRLRRQFAELAEVDRPAVDEDLLTIDISGSQDGEVLDGLSADDYSYELGSGMIVPELDDALRGASAGDEIDFDATHPDPDEGELHFHVTVKQVSERVLPDATDEWVAEASEFDTLDELRADFGQRMLTTRTVQAQMARRDKVGDAVADLVDLEVPDALVTAEMSQRLQDLSARLQAQGLTLEYWLAASGKTPDEMTEELRELSTRAAKLDLALRAVVEAEAIEATDEEVDAELADVARRLDLEPAEVRQRFDETAQLGEIRADIARRTALDWLVDHAEVVDEEGQVVAPERFEVPSAEDDEAEPDSVVEPPQDQDTSAADEPDQEEADE
jgi:trigger factor